MYPMCTLIRKAPHILCRGQACCRLIFAFNSLAVDVSLENLRGFEDHHPALLDGHLNPGLGITTEALALAAHGECAKAGEFHGIAPNECLADFAQGLLDHSGRLGPREADRLVNSLAQVRSGDSFAGYYCLPLAMVAPARNRAPCAKDKGQILFVSP